MMKPYSIKRVDFIDLRHSRHAPEAYEEELPRCAQITAS